MLIEKEQKGKKRKEKTMRKRIFAAFVCLCMLMALVPSMAYAGDMVSVGGLCEHHTQHDSACGYSEGAAETPCGHEHTEDCYTLVTNCVHEHTAECYSEENTELICGHVCSEESGCITKELNCNHEHDENCGYVPAKEGTPCTYVCEICNAPVAEEPECICDTKCTEEESNADCPVCGENGDISGCVGAAMMLAPMGAGVITATPPTTGDGTKENPYQITNPGELYWFAGLVNGDTSVIGEDIPQNTGACAVLTADITINENVLKADGSLNSENIGTFTEWMPIGNENNQYTGTFDGMGNDGKVHTISGLYVDIVSSSDKSVYAGLFGYVGSGGKIQNVGVKDSYISTAQKKDGSAYVGGVCGANEGTIENCYNTGKVKGEGIGEKEKIIIQLYVGGVCGLNQGIIKNCYNTGEVSDKIVDVTPELSVFYIGGVCGRNEGTITNCYNVGTVTNTSMFVYVGGVCGANEGTIENCYNTGKVSGTDYVGGVCGNNGGRIENSYNTGTVSGTSTVGGVCGWNSSNGTIENSYNTGAVSGTGAVGGVCGYNIGIIQNSYNTGEVSGDNYVGGVCGVNESTGTIKNSYNTGEVSGTGDVGGVCGWNGSTIENCYNTGEVSGTDAVGGVCGNNNGGAITNCNFLTRTATSGIGVDNGTATKVVEKTREQFASGEVAWLLNSASEGAWVQDTSNNMPVLKDNLPIGVNENSCKKPIRITIVMLDKITEQYDYTTEGNKLAVYPQGNYKFFADADYKTWIKNINEKIYNEDTIIYAASPVASITLEPNTLSLDVNNTEILTATVKPDTASQVLKWESSDDTVATVDQNGNVTAVAGGTATITATAIDGSGVSEQCQVNVKQLVTGIQLTDMQINVGETKKIEAKILPDNASEKTLTWSSDDPSVATVDSNGNVTGKSKGTVKITARTTDGTDLKAECTVTVKKKSSGGSVFFWDLKFDTNGGSKIDTVTEWEYSTIDLDEYVPEKEGYKFVGWYADEDLTKEIDEVYLTQDTTVYAKWEKIAEEVPEEPEEVEETEETETISFLDVKERDWFYEAVSYAVENGLMSGMSEDIFAPNTPLTREMLAVVLYNVEGQPESTEANAFTDVKTDMWYTDAILWANENGIVAGYDNGAYGVGDLITREQFATILYRYAQFKGYDTTQGGMAVREFSDYENISDYARPAMAWAVNAGIMGGMDDGTLMPQGKATRAEAATMLMNFCENIVK